MWCTDRRRELQILTDGEVLVERVLLRHVTDVLLQNVEVSVEGLSVEQDFAARRLELAGKHPHQRAFARAACAHHANKLATRDTEGNSIEANFAFAKTVCDFIQLEAANDVSLLLDDALQKIASQNLSDVDSNNVAVLEVRGGADRVVSDQDSTVRFNDLKRAYSPIVIAKYFQQHIPGRAGREQDIIGLQFTRIIRHQIFRFRSFQLKSSAERACASTQVIQIQLGVVVKNDFVFQCRVDLSAGLETYSLELRVDIAQSLDPNFESEGDPQCALTRSRALQLHLLCVFSYPDIDFRKRNILFRIEILRELLVAEHLITDQNSLTGINSTEPAAHQRSPAHGNVLTTVVFQQNQVVITEDKQPVCFGRILQDDVRLAVPPERERFQRRRA